MSEVSYKALGDAVERLREALDLLQAHPADEWTVAARNSVLLSFQFTFSLFRPMVERFLVGVGDDPLLVQEMSLPTLVRSANERGVLRADWTAWNSFRDAKNKMAHVYSEPVAEEILAKVPAFFEEVRFLHEQLAARGAQQ